MAKTILGKESIKQDSCLALIKVFRLKNKRAGELKRSGSNAEYLETCEHLAALSHQAEEEYGFSIWVNPNGRTGHTYPKDYRPSEDVDNDYGEYLLLLNRETGPNYSQSSVGFPHESSPDNEGTED